MRRLSWRQALAYALGLMTATAGFAVGAAWAGHAATGGSIQACVRHESGTLYLQNTRSKKTPCERGDTADVVEHHRAAGDPGHQGVRPERRSTGAPGATGPAGPAGSLNNARSPNGLYTVTLSNQGILLKGPRSTITISGAGCSDEHHRRGGTP